jgi:UDP-N-acetylmuramoylalanine--D-glutamate ligase
MIPIPEFRSKLVGVLGLGENGLAVVRALIASGAEVVAWDGDEEVREALDGVGIAPPRLWPFERLSAVVFADGRRSGLSGGLIQKAEEHDVPVYTDLDLFSLAVRAIPEEDRPRVIAVTGAAGKSVTVSIIAHVLREQGWDVGIGGQLGVPYMALPSPSRKQVYLLELPVRRLITVRHFRCDVSIVLNIGAPPLDEQFDLALRSLLRIFKAQGPSDTAIIGVDDVLGQNVCTLLRSNRSDIAGMGTIIPVSGEASLGHGIFVLDGVAYSVNRGQTRELGNFSRASAFLGTHFNQDAAAAIAACVTLDVPPSMIVKSLHSYRGLSGRFECIGASGAVLFVDDSYASSPSATQRSISACPDVFWIGGRNGLRGDLGNDTARSVLQGAYLLTDDAGLDLPNPSGVIFDRHQLLGDALRAAFRDAQSLAERDPNAAPVILFSPGMSPDKGGFSTDEFRRLAAEFMDEGASYV